jgi:hypothetical protein
MVLGQQNILCVCARAVEHELGSVLPKYVARTLNEIVRIVVDPQIDCTRCEFCDGFFFRLLRRFPS